MGLDIRTIYQAEYVGNSPSDLENAANGDGEWIYSTDGFNRLDGKPQGVYKGFSGNHFRAGSYSGYNVWRALLSRTFLRVEPAEVWTHLDRFSEAPFIELINFSDCDGCIGPKTSAKLAKDFEIYEEIAKREFDEYSYGKYKDWKRAFEEASNNGFVMFS